MLRPLLTSAALVAALSAPGFAQVKLEVKHPEKTASTYKSTIQAQQTLTINGVDIKTRSRQEVTARFESGARRDDGRLPQARTIEAVKTEIELPMNLTLNFDSTKPDADVPDNPILKSLRDTMKAMVGVKFTIVLDKAGKVAAIEGAESALDKAEGLDPMALQGLKARLSPEKLKRDAEQTNSWVPDLLVRKGEPWERTELLDIGGGQTFTFTRQYEYDGTETRDGKELDKIRTKATAVTLAIDADAPTPVKVAKSDLKIDSSEGTILFDRQAGRVVHRDDTTHITGDLTLDAQGQELPAKIDLTLATTGEFLPAEPKPTDK